MIAILPAPPHLAAFRFDGLLSGEDFDVCVGEVERRLATQPRINLFCDMTRHGGITLDALAKDMRYAFGHFGELGRYARCAIVTDRPWIAAIAGVEDAMLSHTEMRCFAPAQREAAMAWAREVPSGPR
ncbi:hypothetical protein FHW12_002481 [Dokdonella fugitiva]|uniref:SpoIIAA-like protein n=1 Tax=Dokdonella fugitiva TaxID=328517 RepID=A0A839EUP4_9GAMM|nr:STAS/SEC14 domain-containing protein [Dokdonella fugitiva]MBA8888257.1 hypothetical protein [Dokdonella fugitiva]